MSLKYTDPNFSPDETRSRHPKYYVAPDKDITMGDDTPTSQPADEPRGKKRARAEDFL